MSHLDQEKPADWRDPGPRVLPWCSTAGQTRGPFSDLCHTRCPGLGCGCACHTATATTETPETP